MIITHKSLPHINQLSLGRFAARARRELRLGQVNVLFTNNLEIRKLNRDFRKKDKATDVLSFPAIESTKARFAGDIAISVEYAAKSAARFELPLQEELKILILHGLIHLAGHDHETDNGEMARLESRLRRKLGLRDGLIARSKNGDAITPSKARRRTLSRSTISPGTSTKSQVAKDTVRR